MTRKTRLFILAGFAIAFVVSVPVAILKTSGYRYNWNKDRLEKTGIIKLVTEPTGAEVWLNGQLQEKRTPMSVFRLLPEDYDIRLSLPGYFDWNKTLEVVSGSTTFTEDVILIRQSSPRSAVPTAWTEGRWSPNGRHLALLRPSTATTELVAIDADTETETLLARLIPNRYERPNLEWSPDGQRLMVQGNLSSSPDLKEIAVYGPISESEQHESVTFITDGNDSFPARWSKDGTHITATINGSVSVLNVVSGQPEPVPATLRSHDAYLDDGRVLVIKPGDDRDQIIEVSPDGTWVPSVLATLPSGDWTFSLISGDHILLSDSRSSLGMAFRLSEKRLFGPWNGNRGLWEKTDGQGRLLLWNDLEISTWNPLDDRLTTINRLGSPIGQCLWDPTGQNVIFSSDNAIFVAETDGRDQRNIHEISRLTEIGPMAIHPTANRQLLFLGAAGHQRAVYQQGF